jgi:D-alanyl-D-alanine carboxypeptidase
MVCRAARVVVAVVGLVSLVACDAPGDADADVLEEEPFDDRSNEVFRGLYDCTERADTGYTQGSAFAIQVVNVDGKPVEVATANAYLSLQQTADADGVALRIVSGFRTMEQQEYLYNCYVNCSCNNCNLAARPGYSNHQSGHALDLNTSDAGVLSWLNANGAAFGFARTVPSEAWHWEWWGDAADYAGPCGEPATPATCVPGGYAGAFCDDDGASDEAAHDCLAARLEGGGGCAPVDGQPAFCGADHATRADAIGAFVEAAGIPLVDAGGAPFADAFVDDDGHPREALLDAAADFGIVLGDGAGHVNPDGTASRSALAVVLARLYALPDGAPDAFGDDDGSANEAFHDRLAAAGLAQGCGAGDDGRPRFCGADAARRSDVAAFACAAAAAGLRPVWELEAPAPVDGGSDLDPGPPPGLDDDVPAEADDDDAPLDLPTAVDDGCAATAGAGFPVALALLLLRLRRRGMITLDSPR